jgi:hypothetical protein
MVQQSLLALALSLTPLVAGCNAAAVGEQPAGAGSEPQAAQRAAQPARPAPSGKTFQHPNGFTFQHPADWRVETRTEGGSQFVQLVPPGAAEQTEGYRILVAPTPLRPTDAAFERELEQYIGAGGFRRAGATEPFNARAGQGAVFTWDGVNPQTGDAIRMRVYAVNVTERAVMIFAVGPQTRLDARDAAMREVAASFAAGRGGAGASAAANSPLARQWDQRLRGRKLTYMTSSSGGSSGGIAAKTVILLGADGQFDFYSESLVTMSVPGAGGSSGGRDAGQGRWRITTPGSNAVLELQFSDGRAKQFELTYNNAVYLNGRRFFVTQP